jgi:lipopolysaccharide/colanic/teichoic acid biosynthesis glycosyltransferase
MEFVGGASDMVPTPGGQQGDIPGTGERTLRGDREAASTAPNGDRDGAFAVSDSVAAVNGDGRVALDRGDAALNEAATNGAYLDLPVRGWRLSVKYALDRPLALLAIVLVSPVLLISALAVLCEVGPPILFRQRRIGVAGREFQILKFRTMWGAPEEEGEADADWAEAVLSRDGSHNGARPVAESGHARRRETRTGRWLRRSGIDELPQLVNVLSGQMSLVGPRPERTRYARRFECTLARYADRQRVKPGITGWAQVNGLRGTTSLSRRVEFDNYYIENWSPWLDLKILLMTLPAPFRIRAE